MTYKQICAAVKVDPKELKKYAPLFVPYVYLDGHRSSCVSKNDYECYKSGIRFFTMAAEAARKLGLKNLITMIYNSRNSQVKGRVDTIQNAILDSFSIDNEKIAGSNFYFYGDIKNTTTKSGLDFYKFLNYISNHNNGHRSVNHHLLVNYSEAWALENLEAIEKLPTVSTVIRFTKGYVSGGWIPLKMLETTFVYSQLPSVDEFWSEESIAALLLISFKNWMNMKKFIGKKIYQNKEREAIHKKRDLNLNSPVIPLTVPTPRKNRIITFDENGTSAYEFSIDS